MENQKHLLESIRDIISGGNMTPQSADDEILDLTQVVNADGSISHIQPKTVEAPVAAVKPAPKETPKPELVITKPVVQEFKSEAQDVLSEIDAILSEPTGIPEPKIEAVVEKPAAPELVLEEPTLAPEPVKSSAMELPELTAEPEPVRQYISTTEEKMAEINNLISGDAANAAKSSISSMLEKLQKPKQDALTPFRSGETVENLVMEMLKPLLKDWLDTNLPPMVQTIVEREIKKILPNA